MITDHDVRNQVIESLGADVDDFDVQAIVDEIQCEYGPFSEVDVLDLEHDAFWAIVKKHAIEADDEDSECEGHESTSGVGGESVYCDGTCVVRYGPIDKTAILSRRVDSLFRA